MSKIDWKILIRFSDFVLGQINLNFYELDYFKHVLIKRSKKILVNFENLGEGPRLLLSFISYRLHTLLQVAYTVVMLCN